MTDTATAAAAATDAKTEATTDATKAADSATKTGDAATKGAEGATAATDTGKTAAESTAAAGTPYKPEGLPDHLLGKNDKETIENINKAYKGAREELGKKGNKAPETAEAYTLTLPDDLKDKVIKVDATGKDPIFESLKPALHKAGISNENASMLVTELYKSVAAQIAKNAETAANDPNAADVGFKQLGGAEKAKPLQDASNAWINSLKEKLGLDDKDMQELQFLTYHSQGLQVLNKLRGLTSEKPIPADWGQSNPDAPVTQVQIDEMMHDQRYIDGDKEWHAAVREKIALKQAQGKAKKG